MKVKISDTDLWLELEFEAETPKEVVILAKYGLNVKKSKPFVSLSFNDTPKLSISVPKISMSRQSNSIITY